MYVIGFQTGPADFCRLQLKRMIQEPTASRFSIFRNPFFPIRHHSPAALPSLCEKFLTVRRFLIPTLIALSLNGFAQTGLVYTEKTINPGIENPTGIITGQIKTTDDKPAAFVTVYLKENNKTTQTDENG